MKKVLLIGGLVVAVLIVGLIVFLGNLNSIIKKGVETAGPLVLQAPVTLDKAAVSIFSGTGQLAGLTIGNPEGFKTEYAFQLGEVMIELEPSSIASDTMHIKSIAIDAPQIIFEGAFGKNNLSQLQANAESYTGGRESQGTSAAQKDSGSGSKKVLIDHLIIKNGSISVSMALLQGQKMTVPLPMIELKDIGKNKDATISDVLKKILAAVNKAAIPAIQSNIANFDEGLKKAGETLQKEADKGLGVFKNFLNK